MTILLFTGILFIGALAAGLLGSLTGLGGGVVLIPLLTLLFKVDIHYAIGTSLISVIATSSGAAAAYVREGFTNIRLGMFLELATTAGAIAGAFLATYLTYAPVSRSRVLAWETLFLLTAVLHAWTKVRSARVAPRLALLEHQVREMFADMAR